LQCVAVCCGIEQSAVMHTAIGTGQCIVYRLHMIHTLLIHDG